MIKIIILCFYRKIFSRNNNYELTNGISQSNSSSRNDLDNYNHNNNNNHQQHQSHHHQHHPHHYQQQQQQHQQHDIQNGHRARSETGLYYDQRPSMHLSPRYESRLVNGSGAPMSTNPLWIGPSSNMAGSQPNLLSHQTTLDSTPLYHQLSPQMEKRTPPIPLQHNIYASYPDNKPDIMIKQQENQQKQSAPTRQQSNRKQATQSQYFDTNEFILRASDGQPLRNNIQYPNRHSSRDYRPHSMDLNASMLDVYY